MILCSHPAAPLRHLVRHYYQVRTQLIGRTSLQPVPARSPQAIEFTFGTPYEVCRLDGTDARNAHPIALVGAQTFRRVELLMQGSVDAFTIVFQPGGLFRLFSVPPELLTDDDFDGEAVLGRAAGELARQLEDASSFRERVRVADTYLCARRPLTESSSIVRTAARVLANAGCIRVSDLAHAAGLGVRQFERRFRYEIGIQPKLYTRIVRFESALQRKTAAPETQWTDIAHALGYHDQMHMVHDFNRLSGETPTAIQGRLDMFVRPELLLSEASR